MKLYNAQITIAGDPHRFRVLNCGRRFGKTTLATEEIKAFAVPRAANVAYIATTYQQSRDLVWSALKEELKGIAVSVNEARLEIRVHAQDGGISKIMLRGWESIDTFRGMRIDFMVLDEVAQYRNFWLSWQEVLRPTLTDTKGGALFLSTPKGFNHFYELFNEQERDPDFKSFHFTTYDNPFIPVEELEKAKVELMPDRFAQEYLADFRKTEGLVYKEFDRAMHLFDRKEALKTQFVEKIGGVDFGWTNPACVLTIQRDTSDCLWVTDEFYERERSDVQVAEYVAAQKFNRVYGDPESPAGIAELRRMRVNVRDVIKGKDSVKNGIDRVHEMLRAGKLKFCRDLSNTIMELETYSYPDPVPGRNPNENPIKENDHAMDALRYCVVMISGGPNRKAGQFQPPLHKPISYRRFVPRGSVK